MEPAVEITGIGQGVWSNLAVQIRANFEAGQHVVSNMGQGLMITLRGKSAGAPASGPGAYLYENTKIAVEFVKQGAGVGAVRIRAIGGELCLPAIAWITETIKDPGRASRIIANAGQGALAARAAVAAAEPFWTRLFLLASRACGVLAAISLIPREVIEAQMATLGHGPPGGKRPEA